MSKTVKVVSGKFIFQCESCNYKDIVTISDAIICEQCGHINTGYIACKRSENRVVPLGLGLDGYIRVEGSKDLSITINNISFSGFNFNIDSHYFLDINGSYLIRYKFATDNIQYELIERIKIVSVNEETLSYGASSNISMSSTDGKRKLKFIQDQFNSMF